MGVPSSKAGRHDMDDQQYCGALLVTFKLDGDDL